MASYVLSGMPIVGKGYEFRAITAAVLGGIALTGRRANIFKAIVWAVILIVFCGVIIALVGVICLASIPSPLTIAGVPPSIYQVVLGVIVLAVVLLQARLQNSSRI